MKSASLLILSILAKAQAYNPFETEFEIDGASTLDDISNSDRIDANLRDLARNAQQNPNLTRGVAFTPFEGVATSQTALSSSSGSVEWTWRVNVSEFAVPSDSSYSEVSDPHVVATTYDFTWPGGGNLSAALNDPTAGLCLSWVSLPKDFPTNITDKYTSDNADDPSCAPVLGQACVDAILSTGKTSAGPMLGRCTSGQSWFGLPECQDTLGYASKLYRSAAVDTISLGFHNSSSNATTYDKGDSEGWYGLFSAPQNGSGSAEYYNATNRLHIAMVDAVLPLDLNYGTGWSEGRQLLCMRANYTGSDTKDNAGSSVGQSASWALFAMTFISFMFMFIA